MDVREVKRGDIWYARLPSHGTGSVQQGDRPVLVIQNDYISQRSPTVIVAVITSQIKRTDLKSHVILPKLGGLPKESMLAKVILALTKTSLTTSITLIQRDKASCSTHPE